MSSTLTPVQRHYLVKVLAQMQMEAEWAHLERLGQLTRYGNPFAPERPPLHRLKEELDRAENEYIASTSTSTNDDGDDDVDHRARGTDAADLPDSPLLRHLFHSHLRTVPGLDHAPDKYFNERWQPLFDEAALRAFSHSHERAEIAKRRFYPLLVTRFLGAFVARGIGIRGQGELRGPGPGDPGTDAWDVGKHWGAGTCKRGLAHPARIDDHLMAKIDALFTGPEGAVWRRAGAEARRVRGGWQQWKERIVEQETGLEETFNQLDIQNIKNLDPKYRNPAEQARNFAAEWMRYFVVVQPGADELFSALKIIHTLFPYWGAIQLLRVANAQKLIAGILAILLARPAGTSSLIQRIVSAVVGGQAKALDKKLIKPLRHAIHDARITDAIDAYVKRGSAVEKETVRRAAHASSNDILTTVLLRANALPEPELLDLQRAFLASPFLSDLDLAYPPECLEPSERRTPPTLTGADAALALRFARSKLYLRNVLKKRDRQQAAAMANSSLIPATIKDTLNVVFYAAIASIARHANLASRLADLQRFNNDAIAVRTKSANTRADWIALAARHEQSLYMLFHELSSIIAPFQRWCQYGVDYMALSTTDPVHPANDRAKRLELDVDALLANAPLTERERADVLREIDSVAQYTLFAKVRLELETRRNYLQALPDAVPPSGLSRDDVPSESMRARIEDVDALLAQILRAEGVAPADGVCAHPARGTADTAQYPWAYFDAPDACAQQYTHARVAELGLRHPAYTPAEVSARVPVLDATRKLLPAFAQCIRDAVPDWERAVKNAPGRAGAPASGGGGGGAAAQTGSLRPPRQDDAASQRSGSGIGSLFRRSKKVSA